MNARPMKGSRQAGWHTVCPVLLEAPAIFAVTRRDRRVVGTAQRLFELLASVFFARRFAKIFRWGMKRMHVDQKEKSMHVDQIETFNFHDRRDNNAEFCKAWAVHVNVYDAHNVTIECGGGKDVARRVFHDVRKNECSPSLKTDSFSFPSLNPEHWFQAKGTHSVKCRKIEE